MSSREDILQKARQRARDMGLSYAGALLPTEAHQLTEQDASARLVDVRSRAELDFVGRVPGSIEVEWKSYPGMRPNLDFIQQLELKVPKDATVMFLCRSGARSNETAMAATQAGYIDSYNVLEGFEGDRDTHGHRNTVGGWRAAGLPWVQS